VKKLLFAFIICLCFVGTSRAWKPDGWVYSVSPSIFSNDEQRWYYLDNAGGFIYNESSTGQWKSMLEFNGWWYITWPWGYSIDTGSWNYFYPDGPTTFVYNQETGAWSGFGHEGFGDIPIDATSSLAIFSRDPRFGNRTTRKVLDAYLPPVDSQGSQGSCVGWAVAYYTKTAIEKKEEGWNVTSSMANIYSPAFIYNQRPNNSGDFGMVISDALDILVSSGCCKWNSMPYDDGDHQSQPSSFALADGNNYRAATYERLGSYRSLSSTTIQEIKDWLVASETPVVIGMDVYDSFMRYRGANNGVITGGVSGPKRGGHAMAIVGYDDNVGGGSFKIVNSWGPDWGLNGFVWIPFSELRRGVHSVYTIDDLPNGSTSTPPPIANNDTPSGAGVIQDGSVINGHVGPRN
jgi:hypothetical protein